MCIRLDLGFIGFVGLHYVLPDGLSGRYYWNFMQADSDVPNPDHWLQKASQQEKLDYSLKLKTNMPPKLREIFEMTPVGEIKPESYIWRDLELETLPTGRILLVGDTAHTMTPFRGEGGYHTLIDTLSLGKILGELEIGGRFKDIVAVPQAVAKYNDEMLMRGGQAVRGLESARKCGPRGARWKAVSR